MFVTNSFLFHKTLRLAAGGGAYAFTGVAVDIRRLNALSAVQRTYSVAGQSAALRKASRIGLVAGAYVAAGQPVHLKRQLKLSVTPASLAIAGQSVALQKSRVSGFVKTDFAISGLAVNLKRQVRLAATAASMSASFATVGLLKVAGQIDVIGADAAIVGLDVQMVLSRRLVCSLGALAAATQQVSLRRSYPIAAQAAVFALAGVSVGMRASKRLSVVKASFNLAGNSAGMTYAQVVGPLAYQSNMVNTADQTNYTWTSMAAGAANANRWLIALCFANRAGTASSLADGLPTSVTIGGVTATKLVEQGRETSGTPTPSGIAAWIAKVPTGTTATVVANYPNGNRRAGCTLLSLIHSGDPAASPIFTGHQTIDTTADFNVSFSSVLNGGFFFMAGLDSSAGRTVTFSGTGVTEVVDVLVEGGAQMAAAVLAAGATGVVTVSANNADSYAIWAGW